MDTSVAYTRIRTAKRRWWLPVAGLLFLVMPGLLVQAQLRLPRLVSSGMVLAHGQPLPVWGWAAPGQSIAVHWQQQVYHTTTAPDGRWQVMLPATQPGGPYNLRIVGEKEITLQDVWVGEVWLCSGQSNMEQAMNGRLKYRYASYVQQAQYPQIRQYLVPDVFFFDGPKDDLPAGEWLPAMLPHIEEFTAVGYFFALERWRQTGRPIGLINASLGGSPAEAWMAEDSIRQFSDKWRELKLLKDSQWVANLLKEEQAMSQRWWQQLQQSDIAAGNAWQWQPADSSWKSVRMPAMLNATKGFALPGVLWLKKKFNLVKSPGAGTAILELGRLVESDSVWINGKLVGTTSYQYPARRYELEAASVLKAGDNEISIRMVANNREGGMVLDKQYELRLPDGGVIDLTGEWLVKQSASQSTPAPASTFLRWKPSGLYNGMIAPLQQYGLTGVLWYQGEANVSEAVRYPMVMRSLIGNWRQQWQRPDLPFLYVQLPAFLPASDTVQPNSGWAHMRMQQAKILQEPHTAMAGIFDLGEWNDIHPENKLDVGRRLAALAVALLENGDTAAGCGPVLDSWRGGDDRYVLRFRFTGGLLQRKGSGQLHLFGRITGGRWVRLKGSAKGDALHINARGLEGQLREIAYDWADNPAGARLVNRYGIPATPFKISLVP